MKVEMWADMVCVWCGIAADRMNRAMEQFEHSDDVELVHRSFRLLPDMPEGRSWEFGEFMTQFRGYSPEQAAATAARVEGLAAADGIDEYYVTGNSVGNSTLAHEFLAWASDQGKHHEAWDLVFHDNFAERADIWSVDDLLVFARRLELDEDAARAALTDRRYKAQVEADHAEVLAIGGQGVPFFVIDGKYGVSGAQSPEVLVQAMQQAWNEQDAVARV
ncbi:DsbA family oxidoreductase [Microbacterium gorillae]|uniref:DsbA family oxidoreductase n=1 Tax=Microbacterium gorillae TaxID=1231063 RepID=UPI00058F0083|nr:DsbA family oxidoreductase [Microbacterium gorillae]